MVAGKGLSVAAGCELSISTVSYGIHSSLGRGRENPFAQPETRRFTNVVVLFQGHPMGVLLGRPAP